MAKKKAERRDIKLDLEKMFLPENIRVNLMLSSLYLAAFEILKLAIVEGTKDFFILLDEVTEEDKKELRKIGQDRMATQFRESYLEEVRKYEKEVGVRLQNREKYGLIPSCQWLQKQRVLTESDVEDIKSIRDHRNEIAHELPTLMISHDFDVNLQHFLKIHQILQKVDVFWARNEIFTDPRTMEEIDISQVPDEEIRSLRLTILETITNTVIEYLNEIAPSDSTIH